MTVEPSPSRTLPKYKQLLLALLINLTVAPFLEGFIGAIFASVLFFYAIVVVIASVTRHKLFLRGYFILAAIAFSMELIANFGWLNQSTIALLIFAQIIYSIFLGLSISLIFREISSTAEVTVDILRGGICIYLMLGFIWSLFYGIAASIDPQAFNQTLMDKGYSQIIYFSFTTLTTLGFGDIIPVHKISQVLTTTEAIVGQLYPTIFIALLVGGYLSKSLNGTEKS